MFADIFLYHKAPPINGMVNPGLVYTKLPKDNVGPLVYTVIAATVSAQANILSAFPSERPCEKLTLAVVVVVVVGGIVVVLVVLEVLVLVLVDVLVLVEVLVLVDVLLELVVVVVGTAVVLVLVVVLVELVLVVLVVLVELVLVVLVVFGTIVILQGSSIQGSGALHLLTHPAVRRITLLEIIGIVYSCT